MDNFRKNSSAPLAGQEINLFEDYLNQEKFSVTTGSKEKLNYPKSNVLGFSFKNGNKLYLRPSGTEPKIKFYIMIQENDGTLEQKKNQAHKITQELLAFIKEKVDNI